VERVETIGTLLLPGLSFPFWRSVVISNLFKK
jgi:hypothetical protein